MEHYSHPPFLPDYLLLIRLLPKQGRPMSKDFTGIRGLSTEKNSDFFSAKEQLGNGDWRMKTRKMKINSNLYNTKTYLFFGHP